MGWDESGGGDGVEEEGEQVLCESVVVGLLACLFFWGGSLLLWPQWQPGRYSLTAYSSASFYQTPRQFFCISPQCGG